MPVDLPNKHAHDHALNQNQSRHLQAGGCRQCVPVGHLFFCALIVLGIEVHGVLDLPVANLGRPAVGMARSRLLVHRLALLQRSLGLAPMMLPRSHVLQPAVPMLFVVPAGELLYPKPLFVQRLKGPLGPHRAVLGRGNCASAKALSLLIISALDFFGRRYSGLAGGSKPPTAESFRCRIRANTTPCRWSA